MDKSIKVRAKFANPNGFGFHDNRRRYDGDEFFVAKKELGSWMEVLEEPKPKAKPKAKAE